MNTLRPLLESLRQGERPHLSVDDVEALLGWLTGSAAREGADVAHLPRPGHDPVLLQMVLHRLDDVLFDAGELRPAAAGLDASEPATRRRIRFRRLASAFHPDRFPELADWLTQRSQAVHRAYARFKQDPEARIVAPDPVRPGTHPRAGGIRPAKHRAPPRPRKRRIRAIANQLRARFGNDRYLAPKLIGGLAVLALLPVLNMVLVPAPGSEESANSAVSSSDSVGAGEEENPVSGFGVPVSGDDPSVSAAGFEDDSVGAGSGRDESAPEPPPITQTTNNEQPAANQQANQATGYSGWGSGAEIGDDRDPDNESLARQAPTAVESSAPSDDSASGSNSATGVGAGPAGDDRGPYTRVAAASTEPAESGVSAPKPETGNPKPLSSSSDTEVSPLLAAARRAMNPNGKIATVAALQTVDEQLAAMGLEDDTARLYRRIGEEEKRPVSGSRAPDSGSGDDGTETEADESPNAGTSKDGEASLAGQAPTPVDGSVPAVDSDPVSESSTSAGTGLAGDGRGPGTENAVARSDVGESEAAASPETRNRKPETAEPTITDSQSLAGQAPTPVDGSVPAVDSDPVSELSTSAGAGPAGDGRGPGAENAVARSDVGESEAVASPETRNRKPETAEPTITDSQSLAGQAPTPVDGSVPAVDSDPVSESSTSVGAGPAGDERGTESRIAANETETAKPDAPARKPESGNPKPVPSAQTASELVLGPLGRHPAGEVLQRLHSAMQTGNIAGIAGSFAPDARMGSMRGRQQIADHFRTGFDSADSRQVTLKVLRLGRDDDAWRVETNLDVRVDRDGANQTLLSGRSNFLLVERGGRLAIDRLEIE